MANQPLGLSNEETFTYNNTLSSAVQSLTRLTGELDWNYTEFDISYVNGVITIHVKVENPNG